MSVPAPQDLRQAFGAYRGSIRFKPFHSVLSVQYTSHVGDVSQLGENPKVATRQRRCCCETELQHPACRLSIISRHAQLAGPT